MLRIEVQISEQQLFVWEAGHLIHAYPIATAANGPGELQNSGKTPRGLHMIRAKIGAGYPINTVFVGRRPTGEIYHPSLREQFPQRDWILTRILWLSGLEIGKNRLGNVDSMRRFIYIHGTPDEIKLGVPNSKGCIRMHNLQLIELFEKVNIGTPVLIKE